MLEIILDIIFRQVGDNTWFYSLSTISQTMAGLAGLFAIFAIYKLERSSLIGGCHSGAALWHPKLHNIICKMVPQPFGTMEPSEDWKDNHFGDGEPRIIMSRIK
jgi:hypothetical protein